MPKKQKLEFTITARVIVELDDLDPVEELRDLITSYGEMVSTTVRIIEEE